jgi:2',3'-cyclic-nucleotide 2'-phosphodiesterase (5'-nucleotidase family)
MLAFHREYADAACINGGFVRGDTIYPPGHPLQYRELMAELPFPKCTTVLRITGAAWREAIEQQLMLAPKPAGSFPHYSKNVSVRALYVHLFLFFLITCLDALLTCFYYHSFFLHVFFCCFFLVPPQITYNPQRTVGARVLSFSVNGEPVDPDREYVVVTSNFIAAGGDGVAAFTKGTVLPQGDKVRCADEF